MLQILCYITTESSLKYINYYLLTFVYKHYLVVILRSLYKLACLLLISFLKSLRTQEFLSNEILIKILIRYVLLTRLIIRPDAKSLVAML